MRSRPLGAADTSRYMRSRSAANAHVSALPLTFAAAPTKPDGINPSQDLSMTAVRFRSSGNLTADRRFDYAIDLLEAGDTVAAGDLIEQALELAPDWPAGWFRLAEARAASGDIGAAIAAYRRAGDLDPADTLGARLRLARLGGIDTPAQPPAAYVRGLFDDYADRFDHALVDGLAYRAPDLIAAALAVASGDGRFGSCLDLGCGTGLMAEALRSRVGAFVGVDLSQGMIDKARAKGLYQALLVGDLVATLRDMPAGRHDLVCAADVFCYLGDLSAAIKEAARVLRPGGLLAFSLERQLPSDPAGDYYLSDSLRFRHGAAYVARLLVGVGLEIDHIDHGTLRKDRGLPIEGLVVVASKSLSGNQI